MIWETAYPLAKHSAAGHHGQPSSFLAVEEADPAPGLPEVLLAPSGGSSPRGPTGFLRGSACLQGMGEASAPQPLYCPGSESTCPFPLNT